MRWPWPRYGKQVHVLREQIKVHQTTPILTLGSPDNTIAREKQKLI